MHDGWRTLRFFMLCSPKWLYLLPGTLLIALGLLGYALALNDTLAISTVASGAFIRATQQGSARRVDFFSVRLALTSALARGLFIEPSVSFGLSGPGQSFVMGVTVPYSF